MPDEQDRAEQLDDDEMGGEYPPDKLLGAAAYGAAGTEPGAPESVAQRRGREEPEELPLDRPPTASEPEAVLAGDEEFGDDPTLRDVVQEREAPIPAEEAAIHEVDEDLVDLELDGEGLDGDEFERADDGDRDPGEDR